eukprot:2311956-Prymnesium_polylepis.1
MLDLAIGWEVPVGVNIRMENTCGHHTDRCTRSSSDSSTRPTARLGRRAPRVPKEEDTPPIWKAHPPKWRAHQ